MLSFLSYNKFAGEIKGMQELQAEYESKYGPGNYIPPVRTTFWSFRIMVVAGSLMVFLGLYAMYLMWRKKMDRPNTWFMRFMFWGLLLPPIANTAGWIMTEIGRQPWTVFGLMTTEDSVSPNVSAGSILFSVITFTGVYAILGAVLIGLFIKVIKKGPYHMDNDHGDAHDPYNKEGGTKHAFS
ncbi:Cytochrome bd ubiquinol oxidase subunit 1 [compost metagenome]